MKKKKIGFLYGLVNDHRAYRGLVKIGVSSTSLKTRAHGLNTGSLGHFKPFVFIYSKHYEMMEDLVRGFFSNFTKSVIEGKELYKLSEEKAVRLFSMLAGIFGERYHEVPPSANYLFCSWKGGEAVCEVREDGKFIVPRGTMVRKPHVKSMSASYRRDYKELVKNGVIRNGVFKKKFEFDSKSAAAAMIFGMQRNGKTTWKHL